MTTSTIESVRRYYFLKRLYARQLGDDLEWVWLAKQQSVVGVALPLDFPHLLKLETAGYTTVEDLTGADVAELTEQTTLTRNQATAILAALAAL